LFPDFSDVAAAPAGVEVVVATSGLALVEPAGAGVGVADVSGVGDGVDDCAKAQIENSTSKIDEMTNLTLVFMTKRFKRILLFFLSVSD
jgi:hypothetical protein